MQKTGLAFKKLRRKYHPYNAHWGCQDWSGRISTMFCAASRTYINS